MKGVLLKQHSFWLQMHKGVLLIRRHFRRCLSHEHPGVVQSNHLSPPLPKCQEVIGVLISLIDGSWSSGLLFRHFRRLLATFPWCRVLFFSYGAVGAGGLSKVWGRILLEAQLELWAESSAVRRIQHWSRQPHVIHVLEKMGLNHVMV